MNQFDEMSEDLTTMMMALDRYPDQTRVKPLLRALERAHSQACKASQIIRNELNRTADRRQRLVDYLTQRSIALVMLGFTAMGLAADCDFSGNFV